MFQGHSSGATQLVSLFVLDCRLWCGSYSCVSNVLKGFQLMSKICM